MKRFLSVLAATVLLGAATAWAQPAPGAAPASGSGAPAAAAPAGGPQSANIFELAKEQVERQRTQPLNNAPVWREVNSGQAFYTTVQGPEAGVLIQKGGEAWRLLRPSVYTVGGLLIGAAILVLAGFYAWRGPIKLHGRPTGRYIERFSPVDRIAHWTMGLSFVILAVSGLILTFGKYLLLPVIGYTLFGWLANLAKNLHNFVGPVFGVALLLFIVLFVRDNLPRAYDLKWLAKFGGMLDKSGGHVPSGRFNAGEKALFWLLVCVLSVVLVLSGLWLNFPNFDQTRATMQTANTIHLAAAMLGIAMACFHIYLGTVGMRGAFEAMRYGYVDETWAREHHEIWYEEVKAGKARQSFAEPQAEVPAPVRAATQGG
jgi:formate dehydrogenase subunit gamma